MPSAFRLGSRSIALIVSFASLVIVGGLAFWIPVPYVTMSPGPTFDTLGKVGDSEMFKCLHQRTNVAKCLRECTSTAKRTHGSTSGTKCTHGASAYPQKN